MNSLFLSGPLVLAHPRLRQTFSLLQPLLRGVTVRFWILATLLWVIHAPEHATASSVLAGFSESLFISGLSSPTTMEFAPDGRLFVAQQGGALRIVKNGSLVSTPATVLTVDNRGERGLLGIAFDPNFASNQYIYLYYTATTPAAHNRVSRFTMSGDLVVAGSEVILLDLPNLSTAQNHNGGNIHFGPDNKLYIAVGENALASNSQNMNTPLGKMLRINADGSIPTDNPFYSTTTGINRSIWALGLRNPFSFAFHPVTGKMWINDVGQSTWEEINEGAAGANYGWPTCEGNCSSGFVNPVYAYGHGSATTPAGIAITGGAFYNPPVQHFPSSFVGAYFFVDYSGWIYVLEPANGNRLTPFVTGLGATVDVKIGPDGKLYHLNRSSGYIYVVKADGGTIPTITQQPVNVSAHAGESATFTVAVSGSAPFTYQWQRNGANIAGATSASYTLTGVTAADNNATFRCVVNNVFGSATSASATLLFNANQLPVITITSPSVGTKYSALDTISYSATATDNEDGTLAASAFSWTIVFHHDTHTHPFLGPIPGVKNGTFQIPNVGETSDNVWYRVIATVTDSAGQTSSSYVDVVPRKVSLTLNTVPSGLQVLLDGQPVTTPYTFNGVVGVLRSLGLNTRQSLGADTYDFKSWSDGGAAVHDIVTPSSSGSFTAQFQLNTNFTLITSTFNNSAGLTIPSSGAASTYPSKITVSGMNGTVSKVTAKLNGLSHTFPDDVDVLLVGPGGQSVVLMSDAGAGLDLAGVNLTFDDSASSALSDESQVVSGTFRPSNFEGADTYVSPAPTGSPSATLAAFAGSAPNGVWSLYVQDGFADDAGSLSGGWTLTITTTSVGPSLSNISNQVIQEDGSTGALALSLSDPDTAASSLTLTATSSNPALIPSSNVIFGGTGAARTVTATPLPNAYGTVDLTVTVSDGLMSASDIFTVSVLPVNDAPSIVTTPTVTVSGGGSSGAIPVTVGDLETQTSALTVTASSSNTAVIQATDLVLGGSGSARTLTVTPGAGASGTADVTLTVTDETGASASAVLTVTVTGGSGTTLTFSNPQPIVINPLGAASVYPSSITVAGAPPVISKVRVTLHGFAHTYPDDVDLLLVGPQGQKAILMSDAGGGTDVSGIQLTFSDDATTGVSDEATLTTGTYKPTNQTGVDTFTAPAPAAPYDSSLSAFAGINPAGSWSLFIVDDYDVDGGSVTGGWSIAFETINSPPTLSQVTDQVITLPATIPVLNITVSDAETAVGQLEFSATSSNQDLVPAAGVVTGGSGAERTLTLNPVLGKTGTSTLTLTVTDEGGLSASTTFLVTVNPAVVPSLVTNTFSFTGGISIADAGVATPFPAGITVAGATTSLTKMSVSIQGLSHTYPDDLDLVLVGPGGQRIVLISDAGGGNDLIAADVVLDDNAGSSLPDTATITSGSYRPTDHTPGEAFPAQVPTGTTFTSLSDFAGTNPNGVWALYVIDDDKMDTGSITTGWSITLVGPPSAVNATPTISTVPDQVVPFNTATAALSFTVADAETPDTALLVTAQSSNTSLISSGGIALGGSGANRTVTLTPITGQSGNAIITLTVSDAQGATQSSSFTLVVQPGPVTTVYANTGAMNIPDSGSASFYPCVINVSGVTGAIVKVKVTLDGLTHTYPDDVDVLLVSPAGQKVVLLSDVGGGTDVSNLTVTLDDDAAALLPDEAALTSGTFKPTNLAPTDTFFAPAPAAPYGTNLSALNGASPNGTWSVYVVDDAAQDSGSITRGWSLTVTSTGTPIVAGPDTAPDVTTGPVETAEPVDKSVWIENLSLEASGQIRLVLGGQPAKMYYLERSVNLLDWQPVQSGEFLPENSVLEFQPQPGESAFFRLKLTP